jgi:NADH:ubiquinone oxidoreductase subunit 3 (subunit A)
MLHNMTILVLLFFVPVLVAVLLGLNLLLAVNKPDLEKLSSYECGMSVVSGQTRNPFSISYYLVCILFLIFDLEIALVFPIAVSLGVVNSYGFWIALLFLAMLTAGFVYELGKGAIKFTNHR